MTEKRFGFKRFEISKTDRFLDKVKLYEIDKNHSDDLDESDLFYVYSDSEENIIQLVDKLNELAEENQRLKRVVGLCMTCKHRGYTETGCLCEYEDCWVEDIHKCENYKEY